MQTARTGAQVDRIERRRLVDVDRLFVDLAEGKGKARPLIIVQPAGSYLVLIQAANRGQHTHGKLGAAHFHREHRHRCTVVDGHILGHVQGQRGLAHRRAAGNDDQIAGLQTRGHLVEVVIAGGDTGDIRRIIAVVQFLDALHHLGQQRIDVLEAGLVTHAGFGNGKDLGLGFVEQGFRFAAQRIQGARSDLVAGCHQLAKDGPFAHDLAVAANIGCRRRVLRQLPKIGQTTGVLGFTGRIDGFCHRHHIDRLGPLQHALDGAKDAAMFVTIEIRL